MLDTKRSPASKWLLYTVVTVGFVAVITPFVWMILGSFKGQGELLRVPPTWWPESPTLENYRTLFGKQSFLRYFFNSAFVAVVITVANVTFSSMVGYALAKLTFRGKKLVFALVMGTLMIPGMVTFVPLFVLVANLGMVDSYPGLILPFLVTPFGVFLSLIHISEPTRLGMISYAVFCLKKKKKTTKIKKTRMKQIKNRTYRSKQKPKP